MFDRNRLGSELQANRFSTATDAYERYTEDLETDSFEHSDDDRVFELEHDDETNTYDEFEAFDFETDEAFEAFDNEMQDFEIALNSYGETGGGRIQNKKDPHQSDIVTVKGLYGKRVPMHKDAADAWQSLVTAARADGIAAPLLSPISGYRSFQQQEVLFKEGIKKHGSPQAARKWVAPPGHSAHQSGRAIDCHLGFPYLKKHIATMRRSAAFAWLQKNAQRFGFYPYPVEPWHWEYNPAAVDAPQREMESFWGTLSRNVMQQLGSMSAGQQIVSKIVAVANREWRAWNYGQLEEDSLAARPLLTKYWAEGAGRSQKNAASTSTSEAWSAAFVSYVMKKAYPTFRSSSAHWQYVEWAKQANGHHPFRAVRPGNAVIGIGDILVKPRDGSGATFDNFKGKNAHGDIVISIDKHSATLIGGNVGNRKSDGRGVTVNTKTVALTSDGKLQNPSRYYAIVKLTANTAAAPAAPSGSATNQSVADIMARIPNVSEPRSVRELRPILDKVRGEIPLDFLAGWTAVESSGRNNVRTRLDERGYFQVHPSESKDYGYDHNRISSDWKYSVAVGIDLVRKKARIAASYEDVFGYTPQNDLYWRVSKLMHWLPLGVKMIARAMREDGFKPKDWAGFRQFVVDNRERIKTMIKSNNTKRLVWDPMQGIENVEKLYRKAGL